MPLLKGEKIASQASINLKIPSPLKNEIEDYVQFAKLQSFNEFLIKACEYVLSKDKDWKKHCATAVKS